VRSIRLLPVVIFAAFALLLFKGIGLLTSGGYVLVGTTAIEAAGGGGGHDAPAADSGDGVTLTMPAEPTMTDAQPTLSDGAPTLATKDNGGHGADAGDAEQAAHGEEEAAPREDAGHGDETAAAPAEEPADHPAESTGHDAAADDANSGGAAPGSDIAMADPDCIGAEEGPTTTEIGHAIRDATTGTSIDDPCAGIDPRADGIPMIQNGGGENVPLATSDGTPLTEKAVLERLAERRTELDAFASELDMRMALVEAAEKRLDERKIALEALEAQINALVAEKRAMEEGEFKALVGMYETMKPGEAAPIFNQLQMNVLVRLARSMNPRKMAPILAKMSADRAEELTIAMAAAEDAGTIDVTRPDVASLPQIVGQ
jgi:flagellar motility protein MotE (MotC chaperone)